MLIHLIVLAYLAQDGWATYEHYRLPESIIPEHYRLEVITHLEDQEDLRFEGNASITMDVLEDTNNITLHSSNLAIDQSKVGIFRDDTQLNCIKEVEVNPELQYYIMHLCEPLLKGKYVVTIPFSAKLSTKLHGYYMGSYKDRTTKEKRWLSSTMFEPTYARLAFPCFDEPAMKANFTILLGHDKDYSVISNMPLKQTTEMENRAGWVWSEFQESVRMSTYLVAYSVNDFAFKESEKLKNDVQFRTWARKDAMSQVEYAAEVAPRVLLYFEDLFGIKFPLPKIDEIALPKFSEGGMENWGLVTYGESSLFYEKNVSNAAIKHLVALVISHELAHMWFGNLVTMKWWTDLWLNEGFATYVSSLGVEHLHPEWSSLAETSVDDTQTAFLIDALENSHPVSMTVDNPTQIYQLFDSISYQKGSCVVRMMHVFMGNEAFLSGITNYLREHSYANAEQDNLWAALAQSADQSESIPSDYSFKAIMDSWTLQTGYPVITVTRDYAKGTATISQTRYLFDPNANRASYENCWWVPLSYTTMSELDFETKTPKAWLECDDKQPIPTVIEDISGPGEWIIFNIQLSFLYRVNYDVQNWEMLIQTLISPDFEKIHPINRAQLINDAFDLALSGDQNYDIPFNLVNYLDQEQEYIPWKIGLQKLSTFYDISSNTAAHDLIKKYIKKILDPIYTHLGGLNDTGNLSDRLDAIKHKELIATWACDLEVSDCIPRALSYFAEWQRTPNPDEDNPVPLNLRSVVYCTSIRHAGAEEWDFLWQRYTNSNVAAERLDILKSLKCSRSEKVVKGSLKWTFTENSDIRKQDSYTAFESVASGEIGFPLARDYFMKNIQKIYNYYHPDANQLGRLLRPLASQMNTDSELSAMKEFTDKNKDLFAKASQAVARSLEMIEINIQWRSRNSQALSEILSAYANTD